MEGVEIRRQRDYHKIGGDQRGAVERTEVGPHVHENDVIYRHCNTIIVTEDGCEVVSKVPRGVLWV